MRQFARRNDIPLLWVLDLQAKAFYARVSTFIALEERQDTRRHLLPMLSEGVFNRSILRLTISQLLLLL